MIAFKTIFEAIFKIYSLVCGVHHHFYAKLEDYILDDETNQRFRTKKSILISHSYLIILFYLASPLVNSRSRLITSVVHIISALCQLRILKGKNYSLIGSYVYLYAIGSMLFHYYMEREALTIMGLVLANQHMFFLFAENDLLNKLYVPLVLIVMRYAQGQLVEDINQFNFGKLEDNINSLYSSWPLVFLFHHYGAKILTRSYRSALINNVNIQTELKETLSLLKKSNEDLQKACQARELFIASVSHELRNPLNSLMGNIELLRLDIKNERWLKTLDICKICSELLLGQINNVLDVAKINAEKLELHYLPENLYRIVERVWNISAIPMKQKKIDGELYLAGNIPKYIQIDGHRMNQILLNLIGNATKFAANGNIKVRFKWLENEDINRLRSPGEDYAKLLEKNQIKLARMGSCPDLNNMSEDCSLQSITYTGLEYEENDVETLFFTHKARKPRFMSSIMTQDFIYSSLDDISIEEKYKVNNQSRHSLCLPNQKGILKIEVTDSGCGMSAHTVKNLFQPFQQADASITRRYGGTGLGLYITKQIVQKMGGEIYAYSKENVGSCFCVLLPLETAEELKEDKESEVIINGVSRTESETSAKDTRVLVVDDIVDNQLILCNYLKKMDITTDTANNGKEALAIIQDKGLNYYSFVLMDLQMPVMDGFTACKEIRKLEKEAQISKQIPIVIVTGNCSESEKVKCLNPKGDIGAYYFFRKPITFDECKSAINNILNIRNKEGKLKDNTSNSYKVLVVDDDSFNLKMLQDFLGRNGINCLACSNGFEAIEAVKSNNINLVLMDCEMPGMDGYETTRKIKLINPNIRIIGVTGHRREECIKKCLESGMNEMETKPINFSRLLKLTSKL